MAGKLFAKKWNLQVGDYVRLEYEGILFTEQIRGIIIHPEYVFYSLDSDSMMPNYGTYGMLIFPQRNIRYG